MSRREHYHMVGAAGVGMSALAHALLWSGHEVTGSDRYRDMGICLPAIDRLARAGLRFLPQDGGGVRADTRAVVVSTAIERGNPDTDAAVRLGVPVTHRAEQLAALVRGKHLVAVTGTSGKSTVTGMLGWILQELGADPVVVNGAAVIGWDGEASVGNFRPGQTDLWIIEADESDRSLLRFQPDWAIVTNVSRDHFGLEETAALFRMFSRQVRIGCVSPRTMPVFLDQCDPYVSPGESRFVYAGVGFHVPLPGLHNAENALQAVLLCERLGYRLPAISAALATFPGIRRRLELVGGARGVCVYDDYGHNPAKMQAGIRAVRPPAGHVLAVWRPHGYGPLAAMMDELESVLGKALHPGDRLYVLPVYDVGGTAERTVHSGLLVDRLVARGIAARAVADEADILEHLPSVAREGDVVLVMGARDPGLPKLARAVRDALAASHPNADDPTALGCR